MEGKPASSAGIMFVPSTPASALQGLVPVWALFLLGVIIGQLLPRSRWATARWTRLPRTPAASAARWSRALASVGSVLARTATVWQLLVIVNELWNYMFRPGTLRGLLRACVVASCGRGWYFSMPELLSSSRSISISGGSLDGASEAGSELDAAAAAAAADGGNDEWYVDEKDVAFFEDRALSATPGPAGASPWELMLDKDVPGSVKYSAWRRTLPDGKTEYKSVTVAPDVTPVEFMDMYLDDAFRRNWDGMVIHHEVLEHGRFDDRRQVVRWVRRFPFAFLSDREYCIARRVFRSGTSSGDSDGTLTACTKAIRHPREYGGTGVVRMDVFHSHWRSRSVPDPWGGAAPATETVLLHHEQFKIPERLARFAVSHGMWGFVRKFAATAPQFVEARRRRVAPWADDPQAYGAGFAPNPPLGLAWDGSDGGSGSSGATSSGGSSGLSNASSSAGGEQRRDAYRPRRRRLPAAAAVVIVGGLAVAARAAASRRSSSDGGSSSGGGASSSSNSAAAAAARRQHRRLGDERPRAAQLLRM